MVEPVKTKPIRILIADDHEVVRRGLRAILETRPGLEVAGEAANGREVIDRALQLKPDIIIMDISMPDLNGLDATRKIHQELPEAKILVLTMFDSDQVVRDVLGAGARGYLLKSDAGRDLLAAIDALIKRRTYFTPRVAEMMLAGYLKNEAHQAVNEPLNDDVLTPREREVLQLVAEGKTTRQTAIDLGISPKTVETHRAKIMHKLRIKSVSELVLYAVRNKMVRV